MTKGSITLFSEQIDFTYSNREILIDWINQAILSEGNTLGYLNIIFCDDAYLLNVNQEYLSHDYYTDIITFQYSESPIEGELFISVQRVEENAAERDIPFDKELKRVIIHGVLHLFGYQDKTNEEIKIIRAKEDFFLSKYPENH